MEIEFGTSGWRGKIADDFTYENVKLVSQAICNFLNEKSANVGKIVKDRQNGGIENEHTITAGNTEKIIIVGYDTRFLSEEFAKCASGVFCANGFKVLYCETFTPTPVLAAAILKEKALGAINITASHNPYNYNGVKFSPCWGGPALPEDTEIITDKSNELLKNPHYKFIEFDEAKDKSLLKEVSFIDYYIGLIEDKIDFNLIKSNGSNIYIIVNPMHGTSSGVIDKVLKKNGIDFDILNPQRDAFFGAGKAPDPSDKNLADLKARIKEYNDKRNNNSDGKNKKIAFGLATDGDADRYGIIDEEGRFVEPNIILPMLYNYYISGKNIKGDAARSVATSALIDRVARKYGFKIHETPVGFKYLGKLISEKKVIMAGEESSGLTVINHTPDKDGIFTCLLVLEMLSFYKKPLNSLVKEFMEEFGPIFTKRINEPVNREKFKANIDSKMAAFPSIFEGKKVINKSFVDGYKIFFEDDAWLLARLSGTEEVMRIYGEADTSETLNLLIESFKTYLNK
ncbi:MAG: phosphoglucomutase/phosphomannomutase family protein [Candidatus Acididesulfobacter guangdongensis]|uniref:Phosphoglucomutase/phosphomannomutase family protein n=1 Tax=Acididesulfobacter guangdongensis TaxID=2597225 RepID=A0A519BJB4_ACIG2|nr:MAG: phosphoglucomutase/phosphomannomutase family protein [Candidatus Acididesulfobacter guangdongensis]